MPTPSPLTPEVLWRYDGASPYFWVIMTPVVADVNGDGAPDVVATYFKQPGPGAVLRALNGRTGALLWQSAETDYDYSSQLAVGDLTGDGELTLIAMDDGGRIFWVSAATGRRLWAAHDSSGDELRFYAYKAPALVNLDGAGPSEVVVGLRAFDATGKLLWDYGEGAGIYGALPVVADLDGDGRPEVSDGYACVRWDGKSCPWRGEGFGGLPAVADFVDANGVPGQDGRPELAVVNDGRLALVNGRTGELEGRPIALPGGGMGGPPTVADFDGDGQPEVGVAGYNYTVFKLNLGMPATWSVLWTRRVHDFTSSATGSSVFDFNGDGFSEVVYADENTLRVYHGVDGTELLSLPHCSGTFYENPVIVDVDGDGHADIVVPEDNHGPELAGCAPGSMGGIIVYRDAFDGWAPTRPIWNQHTYHVTNVCDGQDLVCGGAGSPGNGHGRIPLTEPPNWALSNARADVSVPVLNNYRQNNTTAKADTKAPDVRPRDVRVDGAMCPETVMLKVHVGNRGEVATKPDMKVAFYEDGTGRLLATTMVPAAIEPGKVVEVIATWQPRSDQQWPVSIVTAVDDDGTGVGTELECHENNNVSPPVLVGCEP